MARADVLQLVSDLSLSITDATEVGEYYDEIVKELGFLELLTSTEAQVISANQLTLDTADDTIRILDIHSSQVGRLDKTSANALRAILGNGWRGAKGTTIAYSQDQESDDTIRLVPTPATPMQVTILRTDSRDDVPVWLELPIALEIFAREMSRESDHQDVKLAEVAAKLSRLAFELLGVDIRGPKKSDPHG